MKFKELLTESTTINVSVVKMDNRKITKSVFNQIQIKCFYDRDYKILKDIKILGYLIDKERWLIWTNGRNYFKYPLKYVVDISQIDVEYSTSQLKKFKRTAFKYKHLHDEDLFIEHSTIREALVQEDLNKVVNTIKYLKKFLEDIEDHQIWY
jgi:hypothetical protein